MEAGFVRLVETIVRERGKEALFELAEWPAPLWDGAKGQYKPEGRRLLMAVEGGTAKAIDGARDLVLCKKQEVENLRNGYSMDAEMAAEVVDLLAFVLRGDRAKTSVRVAVSQPAEPPQQPRPQPAVPGPKPAVEARPSPPQPRVVSPPSRSSLGASPGNGFVLIPGGTFTMGSPSSEPDRRDDETPHQVTVYSFYMGQYAVTQGEYEAVMGTNPSHFKGGKRPVEEVSWYDAVEYCNARSLAERRSPAYTIDKSREDPNNRAPRTGKYEWDHDTVRWGVAWNPGANGYRLPTEAEWEYAARGGNQSRGYIYAGSNKVDEVGWYDGNSGNQTHEVGKKKANELGLYDMSGNVWEWCWDWYGPYPSGSQKDPIGASSGSFRVLRGGSWDDYAQFLRSALRNWCGPGYRSCTYGIRLVRP